MKNHITDETRQVNQVVREAHIRESEPGRTLPIFGRDYARMYGERAIWMMTTQATADQVRFAARLAGRFARMAAPKGTV
jgi:hypothetical protein